MIKVRFYLANKREISSIDAIVRFSGERYKYPAGISVLEKFWNKNQQRAREVKEYEDAAIINGRLDIVESAILSVTNTFIAKAIIPSQLEFTSAVDITLNHKDEKVSEYFTDFIENYYLTLQRSKSTYKKYKTTLNKLREYEKEKRCRITFDNIDIAFYNSLMTWYTSRGFGINYFGDLVKNTKFFFCEARKNKLHSLELPNDFKTLSTDVDAVYLDDNELLKLHTLNITEDLIIENYDTSILNVTGNIERMIVSLIDCRDRFLIGSYTALRYSDYSSLKGLKSTDNFITRISEKTGIKTVIPMHPVIKEILRRRGEILPPAISNQKMNERIKILCKLAGIKDPIEFTKYKLKGKNRGVYEKWQLVTTHTARRSGCTNMFLAGIDPIFIMACSGHKTLKSFMKYIRASQLQVAQKLKEHSYFQEKTRSVQPGHGRPVRPHFSLWQGIEN